MEESFAVSVPHAAPARGQRAESAAGGAWPLVAETIRTPGLALLPLRLAHAAQMARVLGDPALHEFIGGAPASAAELRVRYARMLAGPDDPAVSWCNWVVEIREPAGARALAGTVQATVTVPVPGRTRAAGPAPGAVAELAWVVGGPFQGRGIAKEAARGLARWLADRGVGTLVAHIRADHAASAAVARAVGLVRTDVVHEGEELWEGRAPGT
ncbi:GNAT family N-acetyltransferase [Streptomyces sp. NPDC047002]|uniref:GNAT family N-acetyltransferase n=1 Tax=Streptomyces sp. NPDC047002 TaxID=3155475 RepID=UPI003452DAE6